MPESNSDISSIAGSLEESAIDQFDVFFENKSSEDLNHRERLNLRLKLLGDFYELMRLKLDEGTLDFIGRMMKGAYKEKEEALESNKTGDGQTDGEASPNEKKVEQLKLLLDQINDPTTLKEIIERLVLELDLSLRESEGEVNLEDLIEKFKELLNDAKNIREELEENIKVNELFAEADKELASRALEEIKQDLNSNENLLFPEPDLKSLEDGDRTSIKYEVDYKAAEFIINRGINLEEDLEYKISDLDQRKRLLTTEQALEFEKLKKVFKARKYKLREFFFFLPPGNIDKITPQSELGLEEGYRWQEMTDIKLIGRASSTNPETDVAQHLYPNIRTLYSSISGEHAETIREETNNRASYKILDLNSTRGTLYDGNKVTNEDGTPIEDGGKIMLGSVKFQAAIRQGRFFLGLDLGLPKRKFAEREKEPWDFPKEKKSPEEPEEEKASVDIEKVDSLTSSELEPGYDWINMDGITEIGRSSEKKPGKLLFSDDSFFISVSRKHAAIVIGNDAGEDFYDIVDLGSNNGTFLNEDQLRVNDKVRLKDGDDIRFGIAEFKVAISRGTLYFALKKGVPFQVRDKLKKREAERIKEES